MSDTKRPGVGVGVLLLRDGKFLLGKRHTDSKKASSELHGEGTWTCPGGKVELGETVIACAARELHEETGIQVREQDLKLVSVMDDFVPAAHFVTIGFLCEQFEGDAKAMEPDKITEWRWFPLDDPPSPLFPPSAKLLTQYKRGRVYQ